MFENEGKVRPGHEIPRGLATAVALALIVSGCRFPGMHTEALSPSNRPDSALVSIAEKTRDGRRIDGLLTCYLDDDAARVWLELPAPTTGSNEVGRFLYIESLVTGLGSNPVGLDRGQIGRTRLVIFRRVGDRLLVEEPNLRYRAFSDNPAEQKAVRESFATSILWAGKIEAREADGRTLVDFTSFVVRDAHNITSTLKQRNQGTFSLDADRSVLDTSGCLAFPDNMEFEAILTFASKDPGPHIRATVPSAQSVTLVQHHSLVRLPDDRYRPRQFDPRAPSNSISFLDYSASLAEPIEKKWIARHRLEKTDPSAPRSRVVEPIVYYVDPGAPEPVRSALIEGAAWWGDAFEAAGLIDAFRVEVLPDGVHPLDVRYNVIQWVHRSTRGWSYGGSVTDPRTGEIIKGHVSLGSLRVRQDRLLIEGLVGTERTGSGDPNDPVQVALARIRQLSAHEVGHTLGFTHNFAASTYGDRASVMDYPAPRVRIAEDGTLDFSDAYAVGVGQWDEFAVKYAYSQFAPGADEAGTLRKMVEEAVRDHLLFLSDADARPAGAAHPLANLWDNGTDPVAELEHTLAVRRIALERFGRRSVREGTPLSLLQEVFVPVYLHHRYQLAAAIKVIGGLDYSYAVRGGGREGIRPIDAGHQRRALEVVLRCLDPSELDIPENVLSVLLPRSFGYGGNRELFASRTSPSFDALGAAAAAADLAVRGLLNPERCARIVDQHRRDTTLLGLENLLDRVVGKVFDREVGAERLAALQRATQYVVVARMIDLANRDSTAPAVRSRVANALENLHARLVNEGSPNDEAFQAAYLRREIYRFLERPLQSAAQFPGPASAPPGSPIGMTGLDDNLLVPLGSIMIPDILDPCGAGSRH